MVFPLFLKQFILIFAGITNFGDSDLSDYDDDLESNSKRVKRDITSAVDRLKKLKAADDPYAEKNEVFQNRLKKHECGKCLLQVRQ